MKDKIKLGLVGLGSRGSFFAKDILTQPSECEVSAVCDSYSDRVKDTQKMFSEKIGYEPYGTTDYREIINDAKIDIVYITTAWEYHVQIAVDAMLAGKYAAIEVGGAYSLEDCWRLVTIAQQTGMRFMFMENCCYGREELLLLNMVKQGLLGDVVHCDGGYCHDLRNEITNGIKNRHYRFRNYMHRNCDNYPTHALVPIMKILGINRGNRMLSLTSTASCAKGLHEYIKSHDDSDKNMLNVEFRQGDVVTTVIKCSNGETITLTLDTSLPQYYSRNFNVLGTKGRYTENNRMVYLESDIDEKAEGADWRGQKKWDNINEYFEKYDHPLWKEFTQYDEKLQVGHGGMDWLEFRALIETVKNNLPSPIDVYDAAAAMCISCLSEQSIALGGQPVAIPDFTNGAWMSREPVVESKYCLEKVCEDKSVKIINFE